MKVKGFTEYGVDAVIKFGGSLLADPKNAIAAVSNLNECAARGHRILVVPGGGPTDNTIESLDKQHTFGPDTHHRACARAQDQTGLMISDSAFGDRLVACETLEEATSALDSKKVAVVLPSRIMFAVDPFERTWEITSDAMAAWFAWLVGASTIVVLTNVDGVYRPEDSDFSGDPLPEVSASQLEEWGLTAVDACTGPFLRQHKISAWVLNGTKTGRLANVLAAKPVIGTQIKPE